MRNRILPKLATLTLLSAAMLALPSCSDKKEDALTKEGDALTKGGRENVVTTQTPQGASIVETITSTATVTAVDTASRKVTLLLSDGTHYVVKCGPNVVNFPQIEINDKVKVTMTEELAVFLSASAPPSGTQVGAVSLAPVGAKPGGMVANVVQVTAKIAAIDSNSRNVTLTLPDGSTENVKAGKQVDLSGLKVGDNVSVRHTEALAINVEKS